MTGRRSSHNQRLQRSRRSKLPTESPTKSLTTSTTTSNLTQSLQQTKKVANEVTDDNVSRQRTNERTHARTNERTNESSKSTKAQRKQKSRETSPNNNERPPSQQRQFNVIPDQRYGIPSVKRPHVLSVYGIILLSPLAFSVSGIRLFV